MATEVIKTTFQFRRGLAATWAKNNPSLAYGEPGFEKDTYRLKIGDGVTPWNDLEYLDQSTEQIIWEQAEATFPHIRQETDAAYAEKASSFIPIKNELCVVVFNNKTVRLKIGDGVTVWSDLPYIDADEIKLYDTTGQNTDGTMTQKAITDSLDTKVGVSLDRENETLTFT